MAVTRSWESKVLAVDKASGAVAGRIGWSKLAWLAGASVVVLAGLTFVYSAKTHDLSELSARLNRGELLDLNQVAKPADLLPFLQVYPDVSERELVAKNIFQYLADRRPIRNVGALARLRPKLPLAKLKSLFVVRTPREYQTEFFTWIAAYMAGFYVVFLVWRWSGFRGDFARQPFQLFQ